MSTNPRGDGAEGSDGVDARADRDALLRFVLEQHWGRLALPHGTTACDQLDLSAVSVAELLAALLHPGAVDLRGAGGAPTIPASPPVNPSTAASPTTTTATATAPSSNNANLPVVPSPSSPTDEPVEPTEPTEPNVVSLRSFLITPVVVRRESQRPLDLIQPIASTDADAAAPDPAAEEAMGLAAPILDLILPPLHGGGGGGGSGGGGGEGGGGALSESDAVAQCAFELFAATAPDDAEVVEVVRLALEVPPALADPTGTSTTPLINSWDSSNPPYTPLYGPHISLRHP
jgi:hypothetical protein